MSDSRCEEIRPLLCGFLDGELAEDQAARVTGHLAACARCRECLADLERVDHAVSALEAPHAPPAYLDALAERVRARIAQAPAGEVSGEQAIERGSHRREWSSWWRGLTSWRRLTPVLAAAALAIVILRVVDLKLPQAVDRTSPGVRGLSATESSRESSPGPELALAPDSVTGAAELETAAGPATGAAPSLAPAPPIARSKGESWGETSRLAGEAGRRQAALPAAPQPAPAPAGEATAGISGLGDVVLETPVGAEGEASPEGSARDEQAKPVASAPPPPPRSPPPPGPPPPPALEEPPAQAAELAAGAKSQYVEEKGQEHDQASAKRYAIIRRQGDGVPPTGEYVPGAERSSADRLIGSDPAIQRARALLEERRFDEARVQLDSLLSVSLPEALALESRELRLELAELTLGSPPDLDAERGLATLSGRFADEWPEAAIARGWAASSVIHALEVYRRSGLAEDCRAARERLAVFRERYAGDPEADSLAARASRLGCGS